MCADSDFEVPLFGWVGLFMLACYWVVVGCLSRFLLLLLLVFLGVPSAWVDLGFFVRGMILMWGCGLFCLEGLSLFVVWGGFLFFWLS